MNCNELLNIFLGWMNWYMELKHPTNSLILVIIKTLQIYSQEFIKNVEIFANNSISTADVITYSCLIISVTLFSSLQSDKFIHFFHSKFPRFSRKHSQKKKKNFCKWLKALTHSQKIIIHSQANLFDKCMHIQTYLLKMWHALCWNE